MITENQTQELKKILGQHYAQDVLNECNKRKITARGGKPVLKETISYVLNGKRENTQIEDVIIFLASKKKKAIEKLEKKKNTLLDIKKTTDSAVV